MQCRSRIAFLAGMLGLLTPGSGIAQLVPVPAMIVERKIDLAETRGRIDHLAVDLGRKRLYVAELGNGTVDAVDLTAGKVIHRLTGLSAPQGIAYDPQADILAIASDGDGSLRLYAGGDLAPRGVVMLGDDADNVRVDPRNGLGSLGRGIDLPRYDVVCVNAGIYKPISAYVTNQPDQVRDLIHEDRSNTLRQNLGRVLRRVPGSDARVTKVVVLEDMESQGEFDHICSTLGAMSIEPVQSWWVPAYMAPEAVCEHLTAICETRTLPDDLPTGPDDLVAQAAKLVAEGLSKKEIKRKLRWSVTRKCLATDELKEVEAKIDGLLAKQDPLVRRAKLKSTDKIAKMRERRADKVRNLIAAGKTDGQIRSNMKVYNARQGWHEDEAAWFEQLLRNERFALQSAA